MERKAKGGSTTQVTITYPGISVREYVAQNPIKEMMDTNKEVKYYQTEGGSQLLTHEFLSILGNFGEGNGV